MNEKAVVMKSEIRAIANFRALIISKHYITIILGLTSIYLGAMRFVVSSLYILLLLNALPPIFTYALRDYSKKYKNKFLQYIVLDNSFELSYLKKKYKYSKINYNANQTAYLISMILICLWQFNYNNSVNLNAFLIKLPFITLSTGLTLRFLVVLIYRIKLPYELRNNKV